MRLEDVYVVGVNRHCYRAGEAARVVGLRMAVKDDEKRLTYEVRFDDGTMDYIAFIDVHTNYNYIFTTFRDLIENGVPEITK